MLADFIQKIVGLAGEADRARLVQVPGVHRKVWLDTNDGDPKEIQVDPPLRSGSVSTVPDVVAVAKQQVAGGATPEVWVGEEAIAVVLDREDRLEIVRCPLTKSERFAFAMSLRSNAPDGFSPAEAIRALRFQLHGAHSQRLIDALRSVDFTRKSDGRRVTEHGRESLGRSVEAAVQSVQEIPDSFSITAPVFAGVGLRQIEATVRVGVHIDVAGERIVMQPLADEERSAIDHALEALRLNLENELEGVPIFRGSPR